MLFAFQLPFRESKRPLLSTRGYSDDVYFGWSVLPGGVSQLQFWIACMNAFSFFSACTEWCHGVLCWKPWGIRCCTSGYTLIELKIRLDPTCDCDDVTVSLYFVTCRQYLLFKSNKA